MTRRSRDAEHGPEQRSLPRRFHMAKHGLEKRGKPIVLPIIALLIALGGWIADQKNDFQQPVVVPAKPLVAIHKGEAWVCETHPNITHCLKFTIERR